MSYTGVIEKTSASHFVSMYSYYELQREGTKGSQRGDIFRVIASEDNTVVSIDSNGPAVSIQMLLRRN